MRLWLVRSSEVPIREQLRTQIILGVLSGDLRKGERLPSTRELALRFNVHANTVSAAYRELEDEGWLEARRGSGVFVRVPGKKGLSPELALDQQIANLFQTARSRGISAAMVRVRLRQWAALQPPDHFLLIEPDPELRGIVAHEIGAAVKFPLETAGEDVCAEQAKLEGAIVLVMPSKYERIRQACPAQIECIALQVRSVPTSLLPWKSKGRDSLIAVVSRWPQFLDAARTMLVAAGYAPEQLMVRDRREPEWQDGLRESAAVVCDALTAQALLRKCRAITFPVLADDTLKHLQSVAKSLSPQAK